MPEDQVTEEISEQDTEGEAGFDEFAEDSEESEETAETSEQETAESESEAEVETDETEEAETKTDEKGEEAEPEKELTAEEAINARIKELEAEQKPDGEQTPGDEPEPDKKTPAEDQQPPADQRRAPGRLTKEQVSQHLAVINDDELPEGEILIGDETVNFKELKEDDPETYNAIKVMASIAGAKYLNAAVRSGQLVTADSMKALQQTVVNLQGQIEFSNEMAIRGHGDYLGVIRGKDYQDWVAKQSEGVHALARSTNPDDAAKVLAYFKESVAGKKASDFDKTLKDKKTRRNNLLKGSSQSKPAGPGKALNKGEDEAAFEEHAE